jgi:hypothetical protein
MLKGDEHCVKIETMPTAVRFFASCITPLVLSAGWGLISRWKCSGIEAQPLNRKPAGACVATPLVAMYAPRRSKERVNGRVREGSI